MLKINRRPSLSATVIATAIAVLVFAPMRLQAAEFFRSIEDLPLAPGLTEVVEEGVEFDSPAGRIVTAVADGDADPDAVRAFYRKALPSLGWASAPGGAYRRDGEVLTLRLEIAGKTVKMSIRVVPAPAPETR